MAIRATGLEHAGFRLRLCCLVVPPLSPLRLGASGWMRLWVRARGWLMVRVFPIPSVQPCSLNSLFRLRLSVRLAGICSALRRCDFPATGTCQFRLRLAALVPAAIMLCSACRIAYLYMYLLHIHLYTYMHVHTHMCLHRVVRTFCSHCVFRFCDWRVNQLRSSWQKR